MQLAGIFDVFRARSLRSQFVILKSGRGQHAKFLPRAFTEHGAIQAANVLNSPRAVTMGIHVVRAFVQLRSLLASNSELARKFVELERRVSTFKELGVSLGWFRPLRDQRLQEPALLGFRFEPNTRGGFRVCVLPKSSRQQSMRSRLVQRRVQQVQAAAQMS